MEIYGKEINTQDIVGGDKIIFNFFSYAHAEKLIPESRLDSKKLGKVFGEFKEYSKENVKEVGKILGSVLYECMNENDSLSGIDYKAILCKIPEPFVQNLIRHRYWNNYSREIRTSNHHWTCFNYESRVEIMWLESLTSLWRKKFDKRIKHGIASGITIKNGRPESLVSFVMVAGNKMTETHNIDLVQKKDHDVLQMNGEKFRVFTLGLIMDTCLIVQDEQITRDFVNKLVNQITSV
ncbi:hypothetical protein HY990_02005 [Candidatus Micrarchaeota archaeon]|nr:hypothetical protein [Candidatus Micrarchaeota archaeon]